MGSYNSLMSNAYLCLKYTHLQNIS